MLRFFTCFMVSCLMFTSDVSLKKRISDKNFRYEFYTTESVVIAKEQREYFWFKGGAIHNSEFGWSGELLHDDYAKFYHSNQLAEAGRFRNGLKTGVWKTWFENGNLQANIVWDEGQKDGSFTVYNETGNLLETGKYRDNKKHGKWINFHTKDTLKYSDGVIIPKKIMVKTEPSSKEDKPGFFKRLFRKKCNAEVTNTPRKNNTKLGFFKRIFGKKDKKQSVKAEPVQQVKNDTVKKGFFGRLFSKKYKSTANAKGA